MVKKFSVVIVTLVFLLALSGCATSQKEAADPAAMTQRALVAVQSWPDSAGVMAKAEATKDLEPQNVDDSSDDGSEAGSALATEGWWYLRFKINWAGADNEPVDEIEESVCNCEDAVLVGVDEDLASEKDAEEKEETKAAKEIKKDSDRDDVEDPFWFMGSLIADRILAPVIREQGEDFFLWRFHRRAADDATGHQFSLIFYSTPQTADAVSETIKANELVAQLIDEGVLVEVKYPDSAAIDRPAIADTSDERWAEEIQNAWPIFIMGASEMWLMLTETIADANPKSSDDMSVDELVALYTEVEEDINDLWREEGRHAYFHHLNAIFGYEYLLMRF